MHPNKTQGKNRLDKNIKKAGGVAGRRQESTDSVYLFTAPSISDKQTEDNFG